jgi:DNA-binding transcriptional LysR family regulator
LGALATLPRRIAIRDVHSEAVAGLVLDGIAHVGFAISGPATRGLMRTALPPDDVVCVAHTAHPVAKTRRASPATLKDSVLAVNAWGDGAERFLEWLADEQIEPWRIRLCADATTALILARDHQHVAFVARSALTAHGASDALRRIPMSATRGWVIRLDLLYRRADHHDPVIVALIDCLQAA